MRVVEVEAWPVAMRLTEPYTIAYETVEEVTNILLRVDTDAGISAYGCAAPDEAVTGETPEGALASLECRVANAHHEGSHTIYVGQVEAVRTSDATPLLYYKGGYRSLTCDD